ncbi:MAG: hypothetical protein WDN75_09240 [Bacteroidota bacterium]
MPALALGRPVKGDDDDRVLTSPGDVADERYWEMVKKQFTVPQNLTMLNAANFVQALILLMILLNRQ